MKLVRLKIAEPGKAFIPTDNRLLTFINGRILSWTFCQNIIQDTFSLIEFQSRFLLIFLELAFLHLLNSESRIPASNLLAIFQPCFIIEMLEICFKLFPKLIHWKLEFNKSIVTILFVEHISLLQCNAILFDENINVGLDKVIEHIGLHDHVFWDISPVIILAEFLINFKTMIGNCTKLKINLRHKLIVFSWRNFTIAWMNIN